MHTGSHKPSQGSREFPIDPINTATVRRPSPLRNPSQIFHATYKQSRLTRRTPMLDCRSMSSRTSVGTASAIYRLSMNVAPHTKRALNACNACTSGLEHNRGTHADAYSVPLQLVQASTAQQLQAVQANRWSVQNPGMLLDLGHSPLQATRLP